MGKFRDELLASAAQGYATDELLDIVEQYIREEASRRAKTWNLPDDAKEAMISHVEAMFEGRLTQSMIDTFKKSPYSKKFFPMAGARFDEGKNALLIISITWVASLP